jgi:hypothetical protein
MKWSSLANSMRRAAALCWVASLLSVFTLPSYSFLQVCPSSRAASFAPVRAKGFGAGDAKAALEAEKKKAQGGEPSVNAWEAQYKIFINRHGKYLSGFCHQGLSNLGRGAIYANYEGRRVEDDGTDTLGGLPFAYCPVREFEQMRATASKGEIIHLDQILNRVKTYDPSLEFVVIFQGEGLLGVDIVKPNAPPSEIAQMLGISNDEFNSQQGNAHRVETGSKLSFEKLRDAQDYTQQ